MNKLLNMRNHFEMLKVSTLVFDVLYIILYYQSEGLGADYGSSWVRELIWALLPGEELFAAAAAAVAAADPRGNFEEREPKQF